MSRKNSSQENDDIPDVCEWTFNDILTNIEWFKEMLKPTK